MAQLSYLMTYYFLLVLAETFLHPKSSINIVYRGTGRPLSSAGIIAKWFTSLRVGKTWLWLRKCAQVSMMKKSCTIVYILLTVPSTAHASTELGQRRWSCYILYLRDHVFAFHFLILKVQSSLKAELGTILQEPRTSMECRTTRGRIPCSENLSFQYTTPTPTPTPSVQSCLHRDASKSVGVPWLLMASVGGPSNRIPH